MEKKDLDNLKAKLSILSDKEKKLRNLYLRKLANGELQGPSTGYASVDKPWLKYYDECNIIKPLLHENIYDAFLSYTEQYGDNHVLLEYYGKEYTRKEIISVVDNISNHLANGLCLKKGDCISLLMLDVPEALFLWLASSRLGIICNMIKFDEQANRIKYMNGLVKSKYIFVTEYPPLLNNVIKSIDSDSTIEKIITVDMNYCLSKNNKMKLLLDESLLNYKSMNDLCIDEKISLKNTIDSVKVTLKSQLESGKQIKKIYNSTNNIIKYDNWLDEKVPTFTITDSNKPNENDVSVIVYTGGTTAEPKGVQLTHKNIVAMTHGVIYGAGHFNENQNSMNILPPSIAFYFNSVFAFMCNGIKIHMVSHFTDKTYAYLLQKYRPNNFMGGPILMENTIKSNAIYDASFMHASISGGDKLNENLEIKYNEFLKSKGCKEKVHQGWGMSECCAVASYSTTESNTIGSVGIPLINYTIGVFEYGTDNELPIGNVGELCIYSDTIMKAYIDNPLETQKVLKVHSDGKIWLHTDDLGVMDNSGRIYHKGRIKRMLTRFGTKVWIGEIEKVAERNINVDKCCCVGVKDEKESEVPALHLILKSDSTDSILKIVDDIKADILNQINDKSVPKYFIIRSDFPYSEVNKKVNYKELEKEDIFNYPNIFDGVFDASNKEKINTLKKL